MKLAYLTTCFGTPSHTFIRRELREFEKRDIDVELYGIRKDKQLSKDSFDLVERTRYLYPLNPLELVLSNFWFAVFRPTRYWPTAFSCFASPKESLKNKLKLFYHFLLSGVHARSLEKHKFTHLHAHFLNVSSSIAMYSARLAKIPYSITLHSAGERDLPHVIGIIDKLKHAKSLLMISDFNISYYDEIFPCRKKSSVVRCGMELDSFQFREFKPITSKKPLKVLAVGRFVEKKGFHVLIEAAKQLSLQKFDFELTILGSGPMENELKQKSKSYELESKVFLPGHASTAEVKLAMQETDVVVVPSVTSKTGEMEGIPVVLMEAMVSGIPVIGSSHSGIPELVTPATGTLVDEDDADALAGAIANFKPSEKYTHAARDLIETQFNIAHVVDQRINIFENGSL